MLDLVLTKVKQWVFHWKSWTFNILTHMAHPIKATRNVHTTYVTCMTKFIANVQQLMANVNSPFDAFPYTEYVSRHSESVACTYVL